jgi:hypothetical protein
LDSKRWWQSKAVWGGIIAALGAVGDMCMNGGPSPANVTAFAGALYAIYGRVVATTVIKAG